jgi:hypothetical protein
MCFYKTDRKEQKTDQTLFLVNANIGINNPKHITVSNALPNNNLSPRPIGKHLDKWRDYKKSGTPNKRFKKRLDFSSNEKKENPIIRKPVLLKNSKPINKCPNE